MSNIKEILDFIESKTNTNTLIINKNQLVVKITNIIEDCDDETIIWFNSKNKDKVRHVKKGIIICPMDTDTTDKSNYTSLIMVDNPRLVFSMILKEFFQSKKDHKIEIKIKSDTKIGENVNIGEGTIIEDDVEIGDNTYIGYNNVILSGSKIGRNVTISNNNTIGGIGFGYEKNLDGYYECIPHIGNVIIEDDVEIGNNNCIDRAVIGSTILKKNCKIDNLVHIAHGVEIGENSMIIANSMIAGSVKIGKNSWIAPSTSIINKSSVGDNSMTGIGTVVIKSIPDNELHIGIPSKKLRDI